MIQWTSDLEFPRWFSLILIIAFIVVPFFMKRREHSTSWATVFIGDPSLADHDEREAAILNQASRQALGASFLLIPLVFLIFLCAPHPSGFGLLYLLVSFLFVQRGLFGFFAWKLGLR